MTVDRHISDLPGQPSSAIVLPASRTDRLIIGGRRRRAFALKLAFVFGGLALLLPYFMDTYLSKIVLYRYIEILLYLPTATLGVLYWSHHSNAGRIGYFGS